MLIIEKFYNNFKALQSDIYIYFNYEPTIKEIYKEVSKNGNGLYLLRCEKEYSYLAFANGHYQEFLNKKNAIKFLKYMRGII